MTKRELTELTVVEGVCVGGALALLSTLIGTLTGFTTLGIASIALGVGVAAAAALIATREPEPA